MSVTPEEHEFISELVVVGTPFENGPVLYETECPECSEQAPAVGGEPVGRYVEPGHRYKGAERTPQIRTYVEFPKDSVSESGGYWLEGEPVYAKSYVAPLQAEVKALRAERDAALRWQETVRENSPLLIQLEQALARIAELEAQLAKLNGGK